MGQYKKVLPEDDIVEIVGERPNLKVLRQIGVRTLRDATSKSEAELWELDIKKWIIEDIKYWLRYHNLSLLPSDIKTPLSLWKKKFRLTPTALAGLLRQNVKTLEDLTSKSEWELRQINHISWGIAHQIRDDLKEFNLELKPDPSPSEIQALDRKERAPEILEHFLLKISRREKALVILERKLQTMREGLEAWKIELKELQEITLRRKAQRKSNSRP